MCIPKGAANKTNAEAFINFMCTTDAGLAHCEAIGYSTPLLSVNFIQTKIVRKFYIG